jgi:hypothetical protein
MGKTAYITNMNHSITEKSLKMRELIVPEISK